MTTRRWAGCAVAVSALAALASGAQAAAGTTRVQHARYVGPQAVVAANDTIIALAGVQPPRGVIEFPVPRGASQFGLRVVDRSGHRIAVRVVMYRHAYVAADQVSCSTGRVTLRVPARVDTVQVIPLAGECRVGHRTITSAPTTGAVSVEFRS